MIYDEFKFYMETTYAERWAERYSIRKVYTFGNRLKFETGNKTVIVDSYDNNIHDLDIDGDITRYNTVRDVLKAIHESLQLRVNMKKPKEVIGHKRARKNNKLRGIYQASNGKYVATLNVGQDKDGNWISKHLGRFLTKKEAYLAYYKSYMEHFNKEPFDLSLLDTVE